MTSYRFLWLAPDKTIAQVRDLTLADDAAAHAVALQLLARDVIEVWQARRLVFRMAPGSRH